MDNDDADPHPLDAASAEAQRRVADQLLILGLLGVAFGLAAERSPDWRLFELGAAAFIVTLPMLLSVVSVSFGVTFGLLQAHYVMRFMWGRGQWIHLESTHWEEHGSYFVATILVTVAWGLSSLLL